MKRHPSKFLTLATITLFSFLMGCGNGMLSQEPMTVAVPTQEPTTVAGPTKVSFKNQIQALFDEPLKGTSSSNNVGCIFCHSPAVPVTGSSTTQGSCSGTTTCNGRADSNYYLTPADSAGAAQSITDVSGSNITTTASTATFPKGGASTSTRVSFANAFVKTYSGYAFDCAKVKSYLEIDTSRNPLTSPIDPTQSYLYKKLSGTVGNIMPRNDGTKGARDAARNPVPFTQAQLDLLLKWYNEGADCTQ